MVRVYRLPQRRRTGRCHDPEELAFAVRADAERRFPLILHRPPLNPPNNVFRVGARPGRAAPQTPAPLLLGLLFPDTPPGVTCSLVHHSSPFIEPSRHRAPGIGEFNGVRCERRPIVEPELGPLPMAAWLQSPLMLSGAHHKCLTLVQYFCLAVASVNGGGIMHHAERSGGPVAAAQNCATHGPLLVVARGRRCTAWSSMRRFDWRLSTRG